MNKSKLQIYLEILCTLSSKGSMTLKLIGHEVDLDNFNLAEYLRFLYDRGLVGEQNLDEPEKVYFVTDRALSLLKVMGPLVRNAQRIQEYNFEAISNVLNESTFTPESKKEEKSKWKVVEFIKEKKPKLKLSNFIKIEISEEE